MKQIRRLDRSSWLILLAFTLGVLLLVFAILYPFVLRDLFIKCEIFRYIRENRDAIAVEPVNGYQAFVYYHTGTWDTDLKIGYYYSEDDIIRGHRGGWFGETTDSQYKEGYRYPYKGDSG